MNHIYDMVYQKLSVNFYYNFIKVLSYNFYEFLFILSQGTKVYAHKVVLAARCDVMAAMFSGNFSEGGGETEVCQF